MLLKILKENFEYILSKIVKYLFLIQIIKLFSINKYFIKILSFFSGFYLPASYEYVIERTFPISSGTSCGFLIFSSSVILIFLIISFKIILTILKLTGLAMIYLYAFFLINFGTFYGNSFLCLMQLIGLILTSNYDIILFLKQNFNIIKA